MSDPRRHVRAWLDALAREHLSFREDSQADRDEFTRYADQTTIVFARFALLLMVALTVLWWPFDWVLYRSVPGALELFARWRASLLVAAALSWFGLAFLERSEARPVVPIMTIVVAMVWGTYYVFGRLGDIQSPWMQSAILLPTVTSIFTVRAGGRLLISVILVVTAFTSYLTAFPGYWAYPYLTHVATYISMTCVFAAGLGHGLFILLRRDFLRRRELVRLATTDTLTGAYNRRHFLELAEREAARAARYRRPLSVLMVDIDSFKNINDTFGHDAGDEVLRTFPRTVRTILRQSDLFGRLGGDEFGIVLAETPLASAQAVADRLVVAARDAPILVEGDPVYWSLSIGCAELGPEGDDVEAAFKRADQALLSAKRGGRDRVVGDSGPGTRSLARAAS